MATIYLDMTSGNDANDGLTIGLPKLTIPSANTAAAGGQIRLLDGTHVLTANMQFQIITSDFTSHSGDPTACIIDGSNLYFGGLQVYSGFTVSNIKFYRVQRSGADIFICTGTAGTYAFNNLIFDQCHQTSQYVYCITAADVSPTVTVNGCLFNKNYAGSSNDAFVGVNSGSATGGIYSINKCTFVSSQGTQWQGGYARVFAGLTAISMKNCIIHHNNTNSVVAFSGNAGAANTFSNNCYYTTGGVLTISNAQTMVNNITTDPLFVDLANDDYRLRPSSPCIDTGAVV